MTNGNKFGKLLGSAKERNDCIHFYLILMFRLYGMAMEDNNLKLTAKMTGMIQWSHKYLHPTQIDLRNLNIALYC